MKWKRSIKGLDLGTMKIRIQDHDGSIVYDFKRHGKNNVPDGILGLARFLEEKMGYDLVSLLVEARTRQEQINAAMKERAEQFEKSK